MHLFEKFSVYTKAELESRAEIEYESYAKTINIEAKTMIDMAGKQIVPAVVAYTTQLAKSLSAVRDACPEADVSVQKELILETSDLLSEEKAGIAAGISNSKERAYYCLENVTTAMKALRIPVDKLEMIVDKELWPFPSYGDLIFEV